jgi:hypothetical protein
MADAAEDGRVFRRIGLFDIATMSRIRLVCYNASHADLYT